MKLYRVTNKARTGRWIAAKTAERAREISMQLGDARKLENLSVVDETGYWLAQIPGGECEAQSLRELLAKGVEGPVVKRFQSSNPGENGEWILTREVAQ